MPDDLLTSLDAALTRDTRVSAAIASLPAHGRRTGWAGAEGEVRAAVFRALFVACRDAWRRRLARAGTRAPAPLAR